MKTKYIIIGLILIILIITIVLLLIKKDKNIEDIQKLYFSYSTGYHNNASIVYEIECNKECTLYFKDDGEEPENRKEYKINKEVIKEIEEKLNEYHVGRWDNYNKSNKHVLDGNSFSISIKYKDKESIYASGYESWPANYHQVKEYLNTTFSKYINK